jgi:uncharacterized protein (UPF0335 family)
MTNDKPIDTTELEQILQRIEKGEEEKRNASEFVKDIYLEAKSRGYNTKMIRQIVKLRAKDKAELAQEEAELEVYRNAVNV